MTQRKATLLLIPHQPHILDTKGNGRVVWSDYDFPTDLFLEDNRTVINHY